MSGVFVASPYAYRRRATREVRIGDVGVGGANPIRVQSMTTTNTQDVRATADQAERLAAAGCEIVRITAPSIRDAECLKEIRAELARRGVRVPLVADIHFTPNAALEAALHVEKVRVNPGNYADKKRFEVREYGEREYALEVERVQERFAPLVRRLKQLGRALRIGTNHGSLSDRILNRFGDTPLGMVESALEFLDVCERESYFDVVFSMKASNAQVAIQAYRLLAARLAERAGGFAQPSYPFHVGVTEAGDGEDGRVKSAIGIGALLEDGIGDTIRVSLTEDPVKEVPVARALAARYASRREPPPPRDPGAPFTADPYAHVRRSTRSAHGFGSDAPVRVVAALGPAPAAPAASADEIARELARLGELACEGIALEARDAHELARAGELGRQLSKRGVVLPVALEVPGELAGRVAAAFGDAPAPRLVISLRPGELPPAALPELEWHLRAEGDALLDLLDACCAAGARPAAVSVSASSPIHALRLVAARLAARGLADVPARAAPRERSLRARGGRAAGRGDRARRPTLRRPRRRGRARRLRLALARCRARLPHPPGRAPAHVVDGVHLLSFVWAHALRPRGDHRAHQGAHRAPRRAQDRRDGLHRERARRDGRRRLRLRRLRRRQGEPVRRVTSASCATCPRRTRPSAWCGSSGSTGAGRSRGPSRASERGGVVAVRLALLRRGRRRSRDVRSPRPGPRAREELDRATAAEDRVARAHHRGQRDQAAPRPPARPRASPTTRRRCGPGAPGPRRGSARARSRRSLRPRARRRARAAPRPGAAPGSPAARFRRKRDP